MMNGKAAGPGDAPPDFRGIAARCSFACEALLELRQQCWSTRDIPNTWRKANAVLLLSEGNAELPCNYRASSLLRVGYKALAAT
eukprot:8904008-Pyramimonas_sp.AAC.1